MAVSNGDYVSLERSESRHAVSRDMGDARLWHASHHRSLERRARAAARRGPRAHTATLAVVAGAGAALAPAAALATPASGGSVVAAQKALGVDPDGVVGPKTRAAIRKFQRSHGLPVTGRLDQATRQALGGGGDGPTTPAPAAPPGPGVTPPHGPKGLGITADGRMGPKTRAALRSFQSEHGLPATGRFDAATQKALMDGGDAGAAPRSAPTSEDGADPAATTQAPAPASGVQAAIDTAR